MFASNETGIYNRAALESIVQFQRGILESDSLER